MKKVTDTQDTKHVSGVADCNFYGVTSGGAKNIITRQGYLEGDYSVRTIDTLTSGAGWRCHNSDTLEGLIRNLLNNGFQVFEFDTYKELVLWLLEE
jgi:hypothetical protein